MDAVQAAPILENGGPVRMPWTMVAVLITLFFILFHSPSNIYKYHDTASLRSRMEKSGEMQEDVTSAIHGGTTSRRFGFLALGLFGALLLVRRGRATLRCEGLLAYLMIFAMSWTFASIVWTSDLWLTTRRLLVLVCLLLAALGAATNLSTRQFVMFVALSTALYAAIGLATEIIAGTFKPLTSFYRFTGTQHPNHQGIDLALLLLSLPTLALMTGRRSRLFLGAGAVVFVLLILTKSRTSFAGALLALGIGWFVAAALPRRLMLLANIALPLILFFLFFGHDLLPGVERTLLLGRESEKVATLSDRTPLWIQCWDFALQELWTGYGYGAFWTTRRAAEITATQGWWLSEAHCAYLDIVLNTGLISALAYVLILVLGINRAVRAYRLTQGPEYLFLAGILVFCALNGLLESIAVTASFLTFLQFVTLIQLGFLKTPAEVETNEVLQDG